MDREGRDQIAQAQSDKGLHGSLTNNTSVFTRKQQQNLLEWVISKSVLILGLFKYEQASWKHAFIILTPLNWGLQGYTLFFLFLLKNIDCGIR